MYAGQTLDVAARGALDALTNRFGRNLAGLIAIDGAGRIATPFHTAGMGRGWQTAAMPEPEVRVWPEDDEH